MTREPGAQSPYHAFLCRLAGCNSGKPRQKTAMNIWRRTHAQEIEAEVKRRAFEKGVSHKGLAALREKVVKDLFSAVDIVEKHEWKERAMEEHASDLARWKKSMLDQPSTDPADRQRCIQCLPQFIQPILDGICAATGWKATLIAGGPEPTHGGHLNVLSVHSGTTAAPVKMVFECAEGAVYRKHILDAYERCLNKFYSIEKRRSQSLRDEDFENNNFEADAVEVSEAVGAASDSEVDSAKGNADNTIDGPGRPMWTTPLPSSLPIPGPSDSPLNSRAPFSLRRLPVPSSPSPLVSLNAPTSFAAPVTANKTLSCLDPAQQPAVDNAHSSHQTVGDPVNKLTLHPHIAMESSNASYLSSQDDTTSSPYSPQASEVGEECPSECLSPGPVNPIIFDEPPSKPTSPHRSPDDSITSSAKKRPRADSVGTCGKIDVQHANKRTRKSQATEYGDQNESASFAFVNGLCSLKSQVWTMLGQSSWSRGSSSKRKNIL